MRASLEAFGRYDFNDDYDKDVVAKIPVKPIAEAEAEDHPEGSDELDTDEEMNARD